MHLLDIPRTSDEALLGGGAAAFERFYARHESAVLSYFLRRTRRPEVAADLTAETFARALAGRERFDPAGGPARGWLFGIARHLLIDSLQRGQVEDAARRRLGMPIMALDDEALARVERIGDEPALAALPADQQRALRAHILEERGYDELAVELCCSPSVVRQRVSRGLRTLRNRLEDRS